MTAGTGHIKPLDRGLIRYTVRKTKGIINMMDMPASYPKVLFDLFRGQRERVDNQVRSARGKPVANRQQMLHVSALFGFPRSSCQFVWNPLNKQGRIVMSFSILERRIHRR